MRVPHRASPPGGRAQDQGAFTLPELMVATVVTSLLLSGLITTFVFGLRLFEFVKPKLAASDNARSLIAKVADELRSANRIQIGQGDSSSFTEVAPGALQQGNAIQLYAGTNSSSFVRYYVDATDAKLKRTVNGGINPEVMASSVSNQWVFTSEDYAGNVLTNNQNNRVIGIMLQFYQIEYPIVSIGPGQFYDSYQVRTRITRRTLF
jgi:prepilin-type N-terminal cleavage/methylation domain-containing protein